MEDAIATGSPFINCRGGATTSGGELYLRLHREFEVGRDIWHKHKQDFDGESWTRTVTVNAEDGQRSGAGRVRQDVQSFGETLDISLNNDYNASFNQALYDVTLHGDKYFMDFLRDGVDVKIIQRFPNGSHIEKVYLCNSIAEAGALYDQLDNAEAVSEFSISLNNEPTVRNFGFSPALPTGITQVKADVTITVSDFDIDVTLHNIVDVDGLVVNDTWAMTIIDDSNGDVVTTLTSESRPHEFAYSVQASGNYTIAIGYVYYQSDNSTDYVDFITTKQILATDPEAPIYKVSYIVDGSEYANEHVGAGNLLTKPKDPVKDGSTFAGWFTAETDGKSWDFATDTMPSEALNLYAQFTTSASTE